YTTDGTLPTVRNGTVVAAPDESTPPAATVLINNTTCLRAMGIKDGFESTNV
ncbi:MAG: hypothetical protein GWO24_17125, partial [Akkermansiaceae bacterium]|nr:hypothetical protein [Akkermansiaceae bacterium]